MFCNWKFFIFAEFFLLQRKLELYSSFYAFFEILSRFRFCNWFLNLRGKIHQAVNWLYVVIITDYNLFEALTPWDGHLLSSHTVLILLSDAMIIIALE